MNSKRPIEFFFDIVSPYSYLASVQIDAFAREMGREVVWRPVFLGAIFRASGNDMPARIPAKGMWMRRDLKMAAQMLGVPLRFPAAFPIKTTPHLRSLLAAESVGGQDALRRLAAAFFGAYWGEGHDITTEEWFTAAAATTGLSASALLAANEDEALVKKLKANTEEAVARGAFGAPTFLIGDELFWGHDRFDMMRFYLEHIAND